jgi:hypothetical protein
MQFLGTVQNEQQSLETFVRLYNADEMLVRRREGAQVPILSREAAVAR